MTGPKAVDSAIATRYVPQPHSFHGHLFQARMWRQYAMAWDRDEPLAEPRGIRIGRRWMELVMRVPRSECLRRARLHVQLAREARSHG